MANVKNAKNSSQNSRKSTATKSPGTRMVSGQELGKSPYSQEEAIKLLNSTENLEDRTLLLLGFNTGLKATEIISLESINFEFNNGIVKVWDRKKRIYRLVNVPDEIISEIRMFIDTRKDSAGPKLFPFTAKTIEGRFQRHSLRVLGESRSWEAVRRTYISTSARLGIPIRIVMDNTGEPASSMVDYYIESPITNPRRLVNEMPLYPDSPKLTLKSDELKLILERPFVEKINGIMAERGRIKYAMRDFGSVVE